MVDEAGALELRIDGDQDCVGRLVWLLNQA